MPRVGSSRIRIFGFAASQRARTTFCWLPPESLPTSCSREGVRTRSFSTNPVAMVRSRPLRTKWKRLICGKIASEAFSRTLRISTRPSRLRSSGAKPIPLAMASSGRRIVTSRPSSVMRPPRLWQLAKDDLGQLRPARAHEAGKPDDLARVDVKAHVPVPVAVQSGRPARPRDPCSRRCRWKTSERSRPTISRTISASLSSAAGLTAIELAVAQDRDAVTEPQDLFDAVRHVDDRHTLVAQTPDERKEAIHLLVGERRGRLVEREHPDPRFEGAHDFNELPLGGGKLVAQQIRSAGRPRTRTPPGCGAPAR